VKLNLLDAYLIETLGLRTQHLSGVNKEIKNPSPGKCRGLSYLVVWKAIDLV
jgi:hypothetical protein